MENIDIFKIFENQGIIKIVYVYPQQTRIADPYEKNTISTELNPLPIKAVVNDISFSGLRYKYYGNIPAGSKQILCDIEHKNLLLSAAKIKIDNIEYSVYKDADKNFQMLERQNYLVVVVERKNG